MMQCMKILAVGSPKGGVGKTTITVNLAHLFASAGAKTLVIDADENLSAADWIERAGGAIPVDHDTVNRPRHLRQLAEISGYDVLLIDLPGSARQGGEMRALLEGEHGRPVADLLLMPTECAEMDLRVVTRAIPDILASGVQYRIVFSRVATAALPAADRVRADYRAAGYAIADTMIRRYQSHQDSVAAARPITAMGGGRHSQARQGEDDMRRLARESAALLSLDLSIPGLPPVPPVPTANTRS